MISLQYDLTSESENEAFFGAFFRFVEAAKLEETDSISIRTDTDGNHLIKVITFEDQDLAERFQTYWAQRRKWLGLQ